MQEIKLDSLVWVSEGDYQVTGTITGWTRAEGEIVRYKVRIKNHTFPVRPNRITAIR